MKFCNPGLLTHLSTTFQILGEVFRVIIWSGRLENYWELVYKILIILEYYLYFFLGHIYSNISNSDLRNGY